MGRYTSPLTFHRNPYTLNFTDNGVAAESTKGQGAAELSEGESPSLRVSPPARGVIVSCTPQRPLPTREPSRPSCRRAGEKGVVLAVPMLPPGRLLLPIPR